MATQSKQHRKLLRGAAQRGEAHLLSVLSSIRERCAEHSYQELIAAFRSSAPLISTRLFRGGQSNFRDLAWQRPVARLDLENEIAWAGHWLPIVYGTINKVRVQHEKLEQLVLYGRYQEAAEIIDKHILEYGWSFWATELAFALMQQIRGTEGQRSLSSELQVRAQTRLSGLFAHIFSDRNDDGFSYDAFYAKCNDSFPRFQDAWMQEYLFYRALSHTQNGAQSLAQVMVCDMTSSQIDYYETCIDVCQRISIDSSLEKYRAKALWLVSKLVNDGFKDIRLTKLARIIEPSISYPSDCHNIFEERYSSRSLVSIFENRPVLPEDCAEDNLDDQNGVFSALLDDLRVIQDLGFKAQDEQLRLLKWGVNFKSLSAGQALAAHCAYRSLSPIDNVLVTPYPYVVNTRLTIEDALSFDDERAYSFLCSLKDSGDLSSEELIYLNASLEIVNGASLKDYDFKPRLLTIWVSRHLMKSERYDEALAVCAALLLHGGYWKRQAEKLKILILAKQGSIKEAMEACLFWLLDDSRYSFELPLESIFNGRRAAEYKELDPILVGVVSHFAYQATKKTTINYVCKAACRRFYMSGDRGHLSEKWRECGDKFEQDRLVVFLREVWIDENLALIDAFETTQAVRREQIEVLQQLIQWDSENQSVYANAIRELTFDETLWRGLQQINETRVFVNEPAITRWAINDLLPDFERWRRIRNSSSDAIVENGVVRDYLLDPQIETILKSMERRTISEADTLLLQITERLYRRFLTDPTDGLDCYLSLRIRHGSLKGTLLGPIEEQSLLLADDGAEEHFVERWSNFLSLDGDEFASALSKFHVFSKAVIDIANYAKNEKVQIQSLAKGEGVILPCLNPQIITMVFSVVERDIGFSNFLNVCYGVFWIALRHPMQELADYFRGSVKDQLRSEFESIISAILAINQKTLPLVTALRSIATTVQSQCDAVAAWFEPAEEKEHCTYTLHEAIEIAKQATKNVYRAFPAFVDVNELPGDDLPLSSSALGTLTDCLYVIFENSWKHSGLEAQNEPLVLSAEFDSKNNILALNVRSCLAFEKYSELVGGELEYLKEKYLFDGADASWAAIEGGSGFAKLARMTRTIDKSVVGQPLDFGVQAPSSWYVRVCIPLYKRDSSYDAYQ